MRSNNIGHGTETHWIQVDYINSIVSHMTQGRTAEFWKYVANNYDGQILWAQLFDGFGRDFSNPEFLNSSLQEAFLYADKIYIRENTWPKQ